MRRFSTFTALVLFGTVLGANGAGCTINTNDTSANRDGGVSNEPSNAPDPSNPSSTATSDAASPSSSNGSAVGFSQSNVSLEGIDLSTVGDVSVNGSCEVSSDKDDFRCADKKAVFKIVTQSDQSRVGVYVAKTFRVEANAILDVTGTLPIVFVALDKMEILGTIHVNSYEYHDAAGGFISDKSEAKGGGPGGGGAGSNTNAGGGGSYCGVGGDGIARKGGQPGKGGTAYGNAELSPLIGGSAGGSTSATYGGSGGGAVELVAGTSFLLSSTGTIHVGGQRGRGNQLGAGGGSGGAILIEAESATIAGVLAANGGGGGSGWGVKDTDSAGQDATPDNVSAPGGVSQDGTCKGGAGSGGDVIGGGTSTFTENGWSGPGGGGGGAGRIRINTRSGAATITGTLSPSAKTPCFTQGTLQ